MSILHNPYSHYILIYYINFREHLGVQDEALLVDPISEDFYNASLITVYINVINYIST